MPSYPQTDIGPISLEFTQENVPSYPQTDIGILLQRSLNISFTELKYIKVMILAIPTFNLKRIGCYFHMKVKVLVRHVGCQIPLFVKENSTYHYLLRKIVYTTIC